MDPFYYLQDLPSTGDHCRVTGDEARHLSAARRQKSGDEIFLFNGQGAIARARVDNIEARGSEVSCYILEKENRPPEPHNIVLACAMPKGDRQKVLLDAVTQLGVQTVIPLQCERSNIKVNEKQIERWQRIVLEACKQCRRAWLPVIDTPRTVADTLGQMRGKGARLYLADPQGTATMQIGPGVTGLFVGPEGGFTGNELQQIHDAGAEAVSLGEHILRVEVAAITLLAKML